MDFSTIITFLRQFFATLLAMISMLMPGTGNENGVSYNAKKTDELIFSFSAVSDTHVETNNPDSYSAFSDLLYGIKAGKDHDAAIFLGDNVMNGQDLENIFFYTAVSAVKPAKNNLVAAGNHDFGNGEGDYDKFSKNYITSNNFYLWNNLEKPYFYKVINNCYLIFLASEDLTVNDFKMSDAQIEWLKVVLDEAAAKNSTIFVFNHHPVYLFNVEDTAYIAKILSNYDNLLYIHGHIHDHLDANNFYTWNGVNSINLPRSTEIVEYEPGDGIVVEVYKDEILVRARNFIKGEWIDGLEYSYPLG